MQLQIKRTWFDNSRVRAAAGRCVWCSAACLVAAVPAWSASAQRVALPNSWDPRATLDRPDGPTTRAGRFLTDDEFPPLHFAGPDGVPTGFSVELARAACERLALACTV